MHQEVKSSHSRGQGGQGMVAERHIGVTTEGNEGADDTSAQNRDLLVALNLR